MAFIDNNINLAGGFIDSVPVVSPKDIYKFSFSKIVVAVSYGDAISEILQQLDSY